MSRGDGSRFDEEDDDRPRRRNRNRDEDDDRPRRRDRDDDDDFADDPGVIHRVARPGNGAGIGGLICGILGIVITFGSGGLVICVFCCPPLVPFSWAIAGLGGILGVAGLILGLVSRSQGNPTSLPIWDITLGSIAIALAIVAIVMSTVFAAWFIALPPPNNPPIQQQPQFQAQPKPKVNNNINPKRP